MDTVASVLVSLHIKALTTGDGQGSELLNLFFFSKEKKKHNVSYTKMFHYAKRKNSISY